MKKGFTRPLSFFILKNVKANCLTELKNKNTKKENK